MHDKKTDRENHRIRINAYIDGFNLYKGALEKSPGHKWLDIPALVRTLANQDEIGDIYYFTASVKQRFTGDEAPIRQQTYLRVLEDQDVKVVRGKFRKDIKNMRFVSSSREELTEPHLDRALGVTQVLIDRAWAKSEGDHLKASVFKMEEKGSDVNLASYLLRDCYQKLVDKAIVITGDSDLVTPVQFAKDAGINVRVVVPDKLQNADGLHSAASSFRRIRDSAQKGTNCQGLTLLKREEI
jgi:uncharacterized LabA/DUF88 family protein